jgi:hypothetical protein
LTLDVKSSPGAFVRIQLLDKASKGIFADIDLGTSKMVMQKLEPIGRPLAEVSKADGDWKRLTIKAEFSNEDRTVIVQMLKGLAGSGFIPGGEGVSVRSITLN